MNENQLETFMAVVQCGSCSKAAAELHMTQPTVSYRLQTLEEELGVRLFTRIGTRMEMAAAGAAFVAEAQVLLESMRETRRRMMRYAQTRVLTIGFPEMMLHGWSGIFMQVMQMVPDGMEKLASCKIGRPPEDVQQLLRGEVDLIFTDLGQPLLKDKKIGKQKLFDDLCRVCLRRDHPLASEKELKLEQLRGEIIYRYNDLTFFLQRIEERLATLGMSLHGNAGLTFVQVLPQLLMHGGAVITNQRPVPDPNLVYIPLQLDPPNDIGMAWRKADCPPALRQLMQRVAALPLDDWM